MLKWFLKEAPPIAVEHGGIASAKPWARIGTGEVRAVGGYFTVLNRGTAHDRLLSASSPDAETVEIHAIKVVGAGVRMRPLPDGLLIPADTTIVLKPRGYHLQLSGARQAPAVGEELALALVFEKAGRIDLRLPVEDSGPVGSDILLEESQRSG